MGNIEHNTWKIDKSMQKNTLYLERVLLTITKLLKDVKLIHMGKDITIYTDHMKRFCPYLGYNKESLDHLARTYSQEYSS